MPISPKTLAALDAGRVMWKPGTSGNPGGMPKALPHMRKRCRVIVDAIVIDAWEQEVKDRGQHWVRCSELLTAYGYGSAKSIEATAGNESTSPVEGLTLDELRAIARMKLSTEKPPELPAGPTPDVEPDPTAH